jgi:hypothetical protein
MAAPNSAAAGKTGNRRALSNRGRQNVRVHIDFRHYAPPDHTFTLLKNEEKRPKKNEQKEKQIAKPASQNESLAVQTRARLSVKPPRLIRFSKRLLKKVVAPVHMHPSHVIPAFGPRLLGIADAFADGVGCRTRTLGQIEKDNWNGLYTLLQFMNLSRHSIGIGAVQDSIGKCKNHQD